MFGMIVLAKADANQRKGDAYMSLGKVIRKYRKIRNMTQYNGSVVKTKI